MDAVDFSRSFLTFRIDTEVKPPQTVSHRPPYSLNNARIQIECRCVVLHGPSGWRQQYVLGANCKTERVGVPRDIWTEPNADFVPVFSDHEFMNLKTYARAGTAVQLFPPGSGTQSDRQIGASDEAFDRLRIELAPARAEVLASTEAIIEATLDGDRLVARTELTWGEHRAIIDYPVRTINVNERDGIYQTDTGPVLLPDRGAGREGMLAGLELAFSAFNSPDWIEFLVRRRMPIAEGVEVYHYCETQRWDAKNQLLRLLD